MATEFGVISMEAGLARLDAALPPRRWLHSPARRRDAGRRLRRSGGGSRAHPAFGHAAEMATYGKRSYTHTNVCLKIKQQGLRRF